jgi:hypothetical protein
MSNIIRSSALPFILLVCACPLIYNQYLVYLKLHFPPSSTSLLPDFDSILSEFLITFRCSLSCIHLHFVFPFSTLFVASIYLFVYAYFIIHTSLNTLSKHCCSLRFRILIHTSFYSSPILQTSHLASKLLTQ